MVHSAEKGMLIIDEETGSISSTNRLLLTNAILQENLKLIANAQFGRGIQTQERVNPNVSFWMPFRILRNVDKRFEFRKEAQLVALF